MYGHLKKFSTLVFQAASVPGWTFFKCPAERKAVARFKPSYMRTYQNITDFKYSDDEYSYQTALTKKLDSSHSRQADQDLINEIVLWKINRYVQADQETFDLLNHPTLRNESLDEVFTKKVLTKLLRIRGVRLPMASTILRFRNPDVYQIIDQRAYRFAIGEELKLSDPKGNVEEINKQIDFYLIYLQKLRDIARKTGWPFSDIDRILYLQDQKHNKDIGIRYS